MTDIDYKKRRIATIRDMLDGNIYRRNIIQTTCKNDRLADLMAELVDLENEIKGSGLNG